LWTPCEHLRMSNFTMLTKEMIMSKTLQEKIKKLSRKRQSKVHSRAKELIVEELTLRALRKYSKSQEENK